MTSELGSFGDIVFEVSDSRMRTFKDLQQQVGFDPEKILEMLERLRLDA